MEAVYRLNSSELNEDFLKAQRKFFNNKKVEITVTFTTDDSSLAKLIDKGMKEKGTVSLKSVRKKLHK